MGKAYSIMINARQKLKKKEQGKAIEAFHFKWGEPHQGTPYEQTDTKAVSQAHIWGKNKRVFIPTIYL